MNLGSLRKRMKVSGIVFVVLALTILSVSRALAATSVVDDGNGHKDSPGWFNSLEIDDQGNPVISYLDFANFAIKLVHCNDPDCQGEDETVHTVSTTGGRSSTSLKLNSKGHPVISYYDGSDGGSLKVAVCFDPDCAYPPHIATVDSGGQVDVGRASSLELDHDDIPVISYQDDTNGMLKLAYCQDPLCSDNAIIRTIEGSDKDYISNGWGPGAETSLELDASGNPVIGYLWMEPYTMPDNTNGIHGHLRLARCRDRYCAQAPYAKVAQIGDFGAIREGMELSLKLDSEGLPVMAATYGYYPSRAVIVVRCNDHNCAGGDDRPVFVDDSIGTFGGYVSLELDSRNRPVVSYYNGHIKTETIRDLYLAYCHDPACGASTRSRVHDDTHVGLYTELELDAAEYPVIAYQFTQGISLRLAHCYSVDCSHSIRLSPSLDSGKHDVGLYTAVAVRSDGTPVISYYDRTAGNLKLVLCNDRECIGNDEDIRIIDAGVDRFHTVGEYTSITLNSADMPVISYYDATNRDLRLAVCLDVRCDNVEISVVDSADEVGRYTSVQVNANDIPVITYHNQARHSLWIATCADRFRCDFSERYEIGSGGEYSSLKLTGAGLPVISYVDNTGKLSLALCRSALCITGSVANLIMDSTASGAFTSLAVTEQYAIVSYYDRMRQDLKVAMCEVERCTATLWQTELDSVGDTGHYTSIALDESDNPLISFYTPDTHSVSVIQCTTIDCRAYNKTIIDSGMRGLFTSIATFERNWIISYFNFGDGVLMLDSRSY